MLQQKQHIIFTKNISRFLSLLVLLLLITKLSIADPIRLVYVGELPGNKQKNEKLNLKISVGGVSQKVDSTDKEEEVKDTINNFSIFDEFEWRVQVTDKSGKVTTFVTENPDTLDYGEFTKVFFSTDFEVAPWLLYTQYGLSYELNGSVSIALNKRTILSTGTFNNSEILKYCGLREDNFSGFAFTDTINRLEITYLPHPAMKSFALRLKMGQWDWAEEQITENIKGVKESYALGFYYLSFGIVFLILFVFLKARIENLYFSLFCLFASFSWIAGIYEPYSITPFTTYLGVFALEFLSIFFAKTIRNKDKSKIPLVIMIIVAAISFHPAILYNYSFFGLNLRGNFKNSSVPVILIIIFVIFYSYVIGSSVYQLIKGLRQKSWEARTIVYMCIGALFISIFLPKILGSITAINEMDGFYTFSDLLGDLGLCIYPLSAVIVLGRRNSINQKQLVMHVASIEQLSQASLLKEQEKKLLLENRNAELEEKVAERTHEVIEQKQLIETKNKAITDNLTYAQRIQSALLPDVKQISQTFKDSFVLYRPKDIVSGDFYLYNKSGNQVLIVAGDCTGHGVSGAFMSMIGTSLLNQIIKENGINEPGLLLNKLNAAVIEALKQSRNDSNDGMDIAVCCFNLDTNVLNFAGANRPLWLVRNNVIEVIKPDKYPIGGLQVSSERVFNGHTLDLEKGDSLYLFTDGYADQFGGDQGKKMMTAKFKAILLAIQDMNMQDQCKHLETYFEQWKGKEEQVDDVLVMGIRI